MGQFSRRYVTGQNVFLAYRGDDLVAFATFHTGADNWTLDLLRSADGTSDGTMHAIIVEAIQQANLANVGARPRRTRPIGNWPLT